MQSTMIPRHVVAVHGTLLGGRLRSMLKSFGYNSQAVADITDFIGVHGTITSYDGIEAEDVEAVEALVIEHTANVETESAEDWPAWTDQGQWVTEDSIDAPRPSTPDPWSSSDPLPANAPPSWAEPFVRDYEPSHAERVWVASEGRVNLFDAEHGRRADEAWAEALLTAGLCAFPAPISGGSPADEKPIRLRDWDDKTGVRSRPQSNIRDEDVLLHTGSVG